MKKPKYYPNNWDAFHSMEDDFFDEIPSSIAAIVRVRDLNTGRVKEHVYKYKHAARNKTKKLMDSGNKEITIVQRDTVHFIYPKEKEYDIIFDE